MKLEKKEIIKGVLFFLFLCYLAGGIIYGVFFAEPVPYDPAHDGIEYEFTR